MNTFCQIVHKQCAESDELYKLTNLNYSFESQWERTSITWLSELKLPDTSKTLMKILICMFTSTPVVISPTRTKFDFLKTIRDNTFLDQGTKDNVFTLFCSVQRKYNLLNRLCYQYKRRNTTVAIQRDLFLNPIRESQHNVMSIIQNDKIYLFTIMDLRNIIESALSNSPYHFSQPLPIKNPYNNMPFDKSTLYNIYFFMKRGDFVMSVLFHQYFLCNFNLTRFQDENAVIIRETYIQQYLKNSSPQYLRFHISEMLLEYGFSKKYPIEKDFPTVRLINIMRPYLEMFYKQRYSLDMSSYNILQKKLKSKLVKFFNYNPKFGRKILVRNKSSSMIATYNDAHIPFKKPNYFENFEKSHIYLFEGENYPSESDEEEEEESVGSMS
uniref:Uncharacterized protein n=1 Tax=viral metagenome TaxID=1070528 RepID=A0A6C0JJK5_9ZZZZ